jgi:hypothetical protein
MGTSELFLLDDFMGIDVMRDESGECDSGRESVDFVYQVPWMYAICLTNLLVSASCRQSRFVLVWFLVSPMKATKKKKSNGVTCFLQSEPFGVPLTLHMASELRVFKWGMIPLFALILTVLRVTTDI